MMKIAMRRPAQGVGSKSCFRALTTTTPALVFTNDKTSPPAEPTRSACPICQEAVGEPTPDGITEAWASLPCGHAFGSGCIKTWLAIADPPTCPICRLSMAHSCRHPVLPMLEPHPARFGAAQQTNEPLSAAAAAPTARRDKARASSASTPASPSPPTPSYSCIRPRPVLARRHRQREQHQQWRWRGRNLSGLCGFCAAIHRSPPLPVRLAVAVVKLALVRSGRGRRVIAMQPSMSYGERENDPWRTAFQTWWSHQEPRVQTAVAVMVEDREEADEDMASTAATMAPTTTATVAPLTVSREVLPAT